MAGRHYVVEKIISSRRTSLEDWNDLAHPRIVILYLTAIPFS